MKKSLLIHAAWAVIAVIAFTVGAKRFGGGESSESSDAEARSGGRYVERSASGGSRASRHSRAASRSNRAGSDPLAGPTGRVTLSESGIKSLGQLIQTSNDPIERRIAFSKLLEGLTAENAMLMREQIEHMSSNAQEWKEFHYAWGGLAGEVAVKFGQESKKMDMAACFSGWAGKDPGAAMAWLEGQPDELKNRSDVKWGAVYGLANSNAQLATQFLAERAQAGDKDVGKMTNLVAEAVLRSGGVMDAVRWSQSLAEGPLRTAAVIRVARDYVHDDPEKATAWLASLPKDGAQTRALGVAYSTWASRDPDAVAKKINQLKDATVRDAALQGYATRVGIKDPDTAIEWANSISNEKMREASIVRIGRSYFYRNGEVANKWLYNSGLSIEMQKRIRSSVKRK